jgi:glucose/arabinose dehydrogenase
MIREHPRRRLALSPRLEPLVERLTPTTLPAGFTEATVATGLTNATAMEFSPDGRLFVLEQTGDVELVRSDGSTGTALHLNVDSQGERGLLGIAFDPSYSANHYVYLYYTNPSPGAATWAAGEHNQLSRFTVNDANPQQPVFTSEAPILDWNTLSAAINHNGGAIHFGADGMLYADAGDNQQTFTQGGTTYRVSQTLNDLLGKQLRINVAAFNSGLATRDDATVGHLIPPTNPFVGMASGINQLIYALGLRNPFTFAVQPGTGVIFIDDVGENTWEEIDQSIAGANYGWSGGETDGFGQRPPGPGVYHDPLLAYSHSGGPAGGGAGIVGGTFYDPPASQFPSSYVGKYFYGDLGAGWIRVFDPSMPGSAADPDTSAAFASGISGTLVDLAVDAAGNLDYLTHAGVVGRISYSPTQPAPVPVPTQPTPVPTQPAPVVTQPAPGAAPTITGTPQSQVGTVGQPVTFTVSAVGSAPLAYQWEHLVGFQWQNVGTDSSSFNLAATATTDAGSYRVFVSNAFGGVFSNPVTLTVNFPSAPVPPGRALLPGLRAEFFDFTKTLRKLPSLRARAADVTRTDTIIDYTPTGSPWPGLDARFSATYATRHTGYLQAPVTGRYTLDLSSSDGSKLWLDGRVLINNDGLHPMRTRARTIRLAAGPHALRVDYFDNTDPAGLVLSWSGPGIATQIIPAADLFQSIG